MSFQTPAVLFLIFNRPDTTARVMEAIRSARPARLYVAADGSRTGRSGEAERCEQARRIATQVDWPCEVRTLFRAENLRGPKAVPEAIDWFFEYEEEGIILEDDCLPSADFFRFCAEMLERWRADISITAVCGSCYARPGPNYDASYYASYYPDIWGWATWRRAWARRDPDMARWRANPAGTLRAVAGRRRAADYWASAFDALASGRRDHWDYRWMASVMTGEGVAIYPTRNLVSNLGVRHDASNTAALAGQRTALPANLPHETLAFPLVHPSEFTRLPKIDQQIEARRLGIRERGVAHSLRRPAKRVARFLLGEQTIGAAEYLLRPGLRQSWGGPFNGQNGRVEMFEAVLHALAPVAIIETGTFRATTTELFARTGLPVFTVEGLARNYGFARARLRRYRNVRLFEGDSRRALRRWFSGPLRRIADRTAFFYLDAHWNSDLPLAEELEIIFARCPAAVVMIDDFEVPGDAGYGYDDYGAGKALTAAYVAPAADAHGLDIFYPVRPASQETGARRGCVILAKRGPVALVLENLPVLRKATADR